MIWFRIISNFVFGVIMGAQAFLIVRLRARNRELERRNLRQMNHFAQRLTDVQMRQRRSSGSWPGQRWADPDPFNIIPAVGYVQTYPEPEPDPLALPKISSSTRELIGKVTSDPDAPEEWGTDHSQWGRTAKPSTTPQPQRKAICIDCGRPVLFMGFTFGPHGHDIGEWRDHGGKTACDGAISGISGKHRVQT